MSDDVDKAIETLRLLLEQDDRGSAPYVFNGTEVAGLQKVLRIVSNDEHFRNLRRTLALMDTLTDKQIKALPEALDGYVFGRRMARWLFWVFVGLGAIAANWERIKHLFGGRG